MSVSDNNKNRGVHGDSSSMLGGLPSSSENPPALAVGSVKDYTDLIKKLRSRRVCLQSGGDLERDFPLMREAADAIEELADLVNRAIGFWDSAEIAEALRQLNSYLPDVRDPEWQKVHHDVTGFKSPIYDVYEMLGVYDDPESENIKKGND